MGFLVLLFLGLRVRGTHEGLGVFFDIGRRGLRISGQVGFSVIRQVGTAGSSEVVGDGVESSIGVEEGDGVESIIGAVEGDGAESMISAVEGDGVESTAGEIVGDGVGI